MKTCPWRPPKKVPDASKLRTILRHQITPEGLELKFVRQQLSGRKGMTRYKSELLTEIPLAANCLLVKRALEVMT